jgi:hypothetical protein
LWRREIGREEVDVEEDEVESLTRAKTEGKWCAVRRVVSYREKVEVLKKTGTGVSAFCV